MKKMISVLTATRAEYGLLKRIITKLMEVPEFDVRIAVTGMHLSAEFGMTYQEITQDGFQIDTMIDILEASDTPEAVTKAMGRALFEFSEYFVKLKPDLLLVLGDRYETLAVCCAAMMAGIPIAHLYGGETTQGAVDEAIRHSITKMSYLHFTSTEPYRKRIIQLGEEPERVYRVGAIGVENIMNEKLLSRPELEQALCLKPDQPYALVTFHPVTLEQHREVNDIEELLSACSQNSGLFYIFTKSNADAGGLIINKRIGEYASTHDNICFFDSLGSIRYLSALKYSTMIIGNSSSGLIEAPSFGVPTINIGDRQKGRLQSSSVINCNPVSEEISTAIKSAQGMEFRKKARLAENPYGDGKTSDKIIPVIKEYLLEDKINLKKKFYDIKYEY